MQLYIHMASLPLCGTMGSVAQFDFVSKIQGPGIKNSMTYRLPNSRKSNFATEPTKKRARRHRVVKHAVQRRLTTLRRKSRRQPMLDDALPENTASAVLDDTPSSLQAVEGYLAAPSRRAPSPCPARRHRVATVFERGCAMAACQHAPGVGCARRHPEAHLQGQPQSARRQKPLQVVLDNRPSSRPS